MRLADVVAKTGKGSLPRLVSSTLGSGFALALWTLIVLGSLGVIVAYLQAIFDVYSGISAGIFL